MEKAKVYFTKKLTPETVVEMYKKLGIELPGRVAVKVHSGEDGNQNYLHPEFMKPMVEHVNGTIVECNTAYGGARNTTEKHIQLIKKHGWSRYFNVDIMDAEGPDVVWPVNGGKVLKTNSLGKNIENYDSMLVLSHFKGHPMGGYGGALKQLSIGCASTAGKCLIHSGGKVDDQAIVWKNIAEQDTFCEAMADAASSVVEHFKGKIAFVSMVCNLSVDCDCCAVAEDPCMKDIGILSSLDPVALDQACIDLIKNSDDPGRDHFMERVTSRHGTHTIDAAAELGFGTKEYELISVEWGTDFRNGSWKPVTDNVTSRHYMDTEATKGVVCTYAVKACNSACNSVSKASKYVNGTWWTGVTDKYHEFVLEALNKIDGIVEEAGLDGAEGKWIVEDNGFTGFGFNLLK